MFIRVLIICLAVSFNLLAQQNVSFLGQFQMPEQTHYSDVWGYADSLGNEYGIIGVNGNQNSPGGTAIVNVTDPANPVLSAFIPGPVSIWREIKTHQNYAYVTTEGRTEGRGLQIIDLSQLPDTAILVNTDTSYFISAHNLFIDNGYAYIVGTNDGGGMHILDLTNPVNPTRTAYYSLSGYIHDVYVWNDTVVACAGSSQSYHLVNVTDKSDPKLISQSPLLPGIYAHSGWMTEDKRYFIAAEEFNLRDVMVWDLRDRSTWDLKVSSWQMPTLSTVHNIYVKGNYAHISYYGDGYVVLDISNPESPVLAGYYDIINTEEGYTGAWGCYPYLPSGNTLIASIETGLFILKFNPSTTNTLDYNNNPLDFSLKQNYPNPFNPTTEIQYSISEQGLVNLRVYDLLGNEITTLVNEEMKPGVYSVMFDAEKLSSGVYFYTLISGKYKTTKKMLLQK